MIKIKSACRATSNYKYGRCSKYAPIIILYCNGQTCRVSFVYPRRLLTVANRTVTPGRSKSVVIPSQASAASPAGSAEGSWMWKKNRNSRYSPFSLRYAGSKVLIFHRLVLACGTRTPMAWPPRARVYEEVTVPLSGEIYVRQQNEYRDERGERR